MDPHSTFPTFGKWFSIEPSADNKTLFCEVQYEQRPYDFGTRVLNTTKAHTIIVRQL